MYNKTTGVLPSQWLELHLVTEYETVTLVHSENIFSFTIKAKNIKKYCFLYFVPYRDTA